MKHVLFAEKSLLMDDEAADCLLEYARLLADSSAADAVTVRAISPDGNTVDAVFPLNASSVLMVVSTNSSVRAPESTEAVSYMRRRIRAVLHPTPMRIGSAVPDQTIDFDFTDAR